MQGHSCGFSYRSLVQTADQQLATKVQVQHHPCEPQSAEPPNMQHPQTMDPLTSPPQNATKVHRTWPNFRPPIFWKEVREHYLNGEASTRDLAQDFGIPVSTLQARC